MASGPGQLGLERLAFHQQLGDAEIEQTDLAFTGHQDIRRLQVTVHDPVVMGVLDRAQDGQEQLQPCPQIEPAMVAVRGDRLAFDILEREIRLTRCRDSGVV